MTVRTKTGGTSAVRDAAEMALIEPLETRRLLSAGPELDGRDFVTQTNLVSDGFVPAAHVDKDLVNPWGISFIPATATAPGSPFWISDNGASKATLYDGAG